MIPTTTTWFRWSRACVKIYRSVYIFMGTWGNEDKNICFMKNLNCLADIRGWKVKAALIEIAESIIISGNPPINALKCPPPEYPPVARLCISQITNNPVNWCVDGRPAIQVGRERDTRSQIPAKCPSPRLQIMIIMQWLHIEYYLRPPSPTGLCAVCPNMWKALSEQCWMNGWILFCMRTTTI